MRITAQNVERVSKEIPLDQIIDGINAIAGVEDRLQRLEGQMSHG
jgi:hypothetical protein